MRVHLHGIGMFGRWRLRRKLDVTYPLHHDWVSKVRRAFMNNILANLTTVSGKRILLSTKFSYQKLISKLFLVVNWPGFSGNHSLTEHQKRLHFAMTYKKVLGSGGTLLNVPKELIGDVLLLTNTPPCDFNIAQYTFPIQRGIGSRHLMNITISERISQVEALLIIFLCRAASQEQPQQTSLGCWPCPPSYSLW